MIRSEIWHTVGLDGEAVVLVDIASAAGILSWGGVSDAAGLDSN